jgi:hypothetical protein
MNARLFNPTTLLKLLVAYIVWHYILMKETAYATFTYVEGTIKVCAGLKNLRPAPGMMGICKSIEVDRKRVYLNDNWSWLTFDPTSKS